jgi:hypothetical protein
VCGSERETAALRASQRELQTRVRELELIATSHAVALAVNRSQSAENGALSTAPREHFAWQSLTVVIAFPASQVDLVVQNLHSWSLERFVPCRRETHDASRVALMFYMSRRDESARAKIRDAMARRDFPRHCFRADVVWRDAGLSAAQDVYGIGTLAMWYGLWSTPLETQTNYLLWMEPDLRPVRPRWLERLIDVVSIRHTPVWQVGSLPRYKENNDWHLNGNALYRADDPLFTRLVLNSRDAFTEYLSFDKNLYAHRTNNYALSQRYGHMFQTTDVIQNRANEPAHVEQFLRLNPDTYLVHGRGMVAALQKIVDKASQEEIERERARARARERQQQDQERQR